MAAKKTVKKRIRRSDEQLIQDLQDKLNEVKARAASRDLKKSPTMKASMIALKNLDKALDMAAEEGASLLRHVLADARRPLADYLSKQGVKVGKANLPRGRRPSEE